MRADLWHLRRRIGRERPFASMLRRRGCVPRRTSRREPWAAPGILRGVRAAERRRAGDVATRQALAQIACKRGAFLGGLPIGHVGRDGYMCSVCYGDVSYPKSMLHTRNNAQFRASDMFAPCLHGMTVWATACRTSAPGGWVHMYSAARRTEKHATVQIHPSGAPAGQRDMHGARRPCDRRYAQRDSMRGVIAQGASLGGRRLARGQDAPGAVAASQHKRTRPLCPRESSDPFDGAHGRALDGCRHADMQAGAGIAQAAWRHARACAGCTRGRRSRRATAKAQATGTDAVSSRLRSGRASRRMCRCTRTRAAGPCAETVR